MTGAEKPRRPPEEEAEDQATNEIGYRNVDEEGEYDERPGRQGPEPSAPEEPGR